MNKKRCTVCGCIFYGDPDVDICVCCIDDMMSDLFRFIEV